MDDTNYSNFVDAAMDANEVAAKQNASDTDASAFSHQSSPGPLSRNSSFSRSDPGAEDWDPFPPVDQITLLDILDNPILTRQLEKWQHTLATQTEKVRQQREKLRNRGSKARDRVVEELRRRVPASAEEQLDKYKKRMRSSVERLGTRWNDTKVVTLREKISFIAGVLNTFISGYLIGAHPEYFYYWYTVQLLYFMPIRYYTYHRKGYHYFLADLCYFVNLLLLISIWVLPRSKRLLISTYCLAYGNNAVAIAMWRNSMVFHSLDKVTSLFIHIMPPAALHCMIHLTPDAIQRERFPAIYAIRFSEPSSREHYSLGSMMIWATVPYAVWQLSYHFFITVRRREKIAAGRPTSFTWLRRSYSQVWIGKLVLALPEFLQEPAFMLIQYMYAILTMLPCPLWFWYRYASAGFLLVLFVWSIYNGATFYIDVFGKRFQKELEALKTDVAKWQAAGESSSAATAAVMSSGAEGKEKNDLNTSNENNNNNNNNDNDDDEEDDNDNNNNNNRNRHGYTSNRSEKSSVGRVVSNSSAGSIYDDGDGVGDRDGDRLDAVISGSSTTEESAVEKKNV